MPQSPSPIAPAAALPMEEASAGGTKDWETGGQTPEPPAPATPAERQQGRQMCRGNSFPAALSSPLGAGRAPLRCQFLGELSFLLTWRGK